MESSQSTESEFPLDRLPVLVIEVIAKYLDISDLAACCSVSRGVREAFDVDVVWKPRYDEERVKYLLQTPCKVQPGFVHPNTHISGLKPVSEWRAAFMAENRLLNNWRRGKYKQEGIMTENQEFQSHSRWSDSSRHHKFLTNDLVIATFQDKIKILDVSNYPATHAVNPIPVLDSFSDVVEANDMIIMLYNKFVQVYHLDFSTKEWIIQHSFVMDEDEIFPSDDINRIMEVQGRRATAKFVVVNNYFVGYLNGDSSMHIWNFKTGLKLKKEESPITNSTIEEIKTSNTNLIIVVKQNNSSTFLAYDLSKQIFLSFNETTNSHYNYHVFGDCVSIWSWSDQKLQVYNYQKNNVILSNYRLEEYKLQSFRNGIVFLQGNTLKQFSPSIGMVKILMNNVLWFEVLNNKFIQIQLNNQSSWNCKNVFEVSRLNYLRRTALKLGFKTCWYYLNKHATRYIVRYADGHVLNFW